MLILLFLEISTPSACYFPRGGGKLDSLHFFTLQSFSFFHSYGLLFFLGGGKLDFSLFFALLSFSFFTYLNYYGFFRVYYRHNISFVLHNKSKIGRATLPLGKSPTILPLLSLSDQISLTYSSIVLSDVTCLRLLR